MSLLLRQFGPVDEQAALAAHDALAADNFTFLLGYEPEMVWSDWLSDIARNLVGVDLPSDRVSSAFLAAELDGELVGGVSVRFALNDWLARQVGTSATPSCQHSGEEATRPRCSVKPSESLKAKVSPRSWSCATTTMWDRQPSSTVRGSLRRSGNVRRRNHHPSVLDLTSDFSAPPGLTLQVGR